jgi:hypothetical protein
MIESLKNVRTLLIATGIIWLCVVVVGVIESADFVRGVGAILALIATITIWSMWALDEYGINVDGTATREPKKAKRDTGSGEDARLDLLLSLLTPDQRDALVARLAEDLNADGEAVSLADLLAEQKQNDSYTEQEADSQSGAA